VRRENGSALCNLSTQEQIRTKSDTPAYCRSLAPKYGAVASRQNMVNAGCSAKNPSSVMMLLGRGPAQLTKRAMKAWFQPVAVGSTTSG